MIAVHACKKWRNDIATTSKYDATRAALVFPTQFQSQQFLFAHCHCPATVIRSREKERKREN